LYLDILREATEPPFTGDYNRNGTVDAADYVVWRNTIRQTGFGLPADGDGNLLVDAEDYSLWKARFGLTAGPAAAIGSTLFGYVPEPTAGAMIVVGILAVSACRSL
jgi:hypothetical protein